MTWLPPRSPLTLSANEVQVWRVNLAVPVRPLFGLLDAQEQQRANRLRQSDRFIASHAALRLILSQYLDRPADRLQFAVGDRGKPYLTEGTIEFNLSHSGDWALVAVAGDRPVGVDVEQIRSIEVCELAQRFFHPNEAAAIVCLPPDQQQFAFFHYWTRKEAYLKAIGAGIAFGLDAEIADDWTLWKLEVAAGYDGAVAVQGRSRLQQWEWDWRDEGRRQLF